MVGKDQSKNNKKRAGIDTRTSYINMARAIKDYWGIPNTYRSKIPVKG